MGLCLSQIFQYTVHQRSNNNHEDGLTDQDLGILPIIASPVVPEAKRWLDRQRQRQPHASEVTGVRRRSTVTQFEAEHTVAQLAGRIFHKQHAASSLELFFDLFFVANLAVFTDQHALVDGQSIGNYIGFFSILWTTWFHVSIFDVRFYTDSVVNKLCKLVYFGVMTSLVKLGSIYGATSINRETNSLEDLALLMMGFRFVLAVQYGSVFYFVYPFQKTLVPLLFMIGVYTATGFSFLVVGLTDKNVELSDNGGAHHIARWYIIIGVEAIAVIVVSAIWRVLSFKHTHLVERLGLLTLIIIGEGIIGMLISLASYLRGTDASVWTIIGLVEAAVSLTYAIYLLYFENIDHDRFGSIRQQIWALLHYLLHVVILLTVEGQAALIIWAACQSGMSYVDSNFPSVSDPASHFNSSASLAAAVKDAVSKTTSVFHYADLSVYYDATADIANLENTTLTGPFGSSVWNTTTTEILTTIKINLQYFIFQNFQADGPDLALEEASNTSEKVAIYNNAYAVVFEYFYICAGGILLVLAVMYSFGKVHKQRDEYASIALRVVFGAMLPCMSALAFLENKDMTNSFRYSESSWIIGIVTFTYLTVLFGDNVIKFAFRERIRQRILAKRSAHGTHHHHLESAGNPERSPSNGNLIKMEGLSRAFEDANGKTSGMDARIAEK